MSNRPLKCSAESGFVRAAQLLGLERRPGTWSHEGTGKMLEVQDRFPESTVFPGR